MLPVNYTVTPRSLSKDFVHATRRELAFECLFHLEGVGGLW